MSSIEMNVKEAVKLAVGYVQVCKSCSSASN